MLYVIIILIALLINTLGAIAGFIAMWHFGASSGFAVPLLMIWGGTTWVLSSLFEDMQVIHHMKK